MAPELSSLSSVLAFHPFCLSHRLMKPTPTFLSLNSPKPSYIIVCESAASQTRPNRKLYSSRKHKESDTEPDGSVAASPTRGEIFLDRQQSMEASATVVAATKKKKKKKDKVPKASSSLLPGCYGCGAPLQTSETDAPGYVDPDTYYLKKKHRQLRTALCRRCRFLCHGHMITAVGGNGGYSGGMQFVYAEELREKLAHLCLEKALIVKLVDIVDFNGSFLAHIRDIVGANPIILVVTKIDLLPRGTDLNCVGDWVVEATLKKKLNVISVHLTSSKSLVGITGVVSEIQKEKKGRDVYILGSANVGKSAFINAFLKIMSYKDPVAAAARKYRPIQSAVPGTTLGPIQIDAFLGGGRLFDTPGVHLHHRQAAVVHAEDLPALAPKSRLRGQTLPSYQVASETLMADQLRSRGLNAFTIFWGGLVRIDLIQVLPETSLTFYGPKALKIHMVHTEEADEFYKKEVGGLLTPPTGREKADDWMGLEKVRNLEIRYDNIQRPASDVAISGLGWICVEAVNKKSVGTYNLDKKLSPDDVLLMNVFVPKPVEVFVRPPIPVGKDGGEWYEFRELSEKEEEVRPKWHF